MSGQGQSLWRQHGTPQAYQRTPASVSSMPGQSQPTAQHHRTPQTDCRTSTIASGYRKGHQGEPSWQQYGMIQSNHRTHASGYRMPGQSQSIWPQHRTPETDNRTSASGMHGRGQKKSKGKKNKGKKSKGKKDYPQPSTCMCNPEDLKNKLECEDFHTLKSNIDSFFTPELLHDYNQLLEGVHGIFEHSKKNTKLKCSTIPNFQKFYPLLLYIPEAISKIGNESHSLHSKLLEVEKNEQAKTIHALDNNVKQINQRLQCDAKHYEDIIWKLRQECDNAINVWKKLEGEKNEQAKTIHKLDNNLRQINRRLQSDAKHYEDSIWKLRQECDNAIKHQQQNLTDQEAQYKDLLDRRNNEIADLKGEKQRYNEQLKDYERQITSLQRELRNKATTVSHYKTSLSDLNSNLTQTTQDLHKANIKIHTLEAENQNLVSQLNEKRYSHKIQPRFTTVVPLQKNYGESNYTTAKHTEEAELVKLRKEVSEKDRQLALVQDKLKDTEEELQKRVQMVEDLHGARNFQVGEHQRNFSSQKREVYKSKQYVELSVGSNEISAQQKNANDDTVSAKQLSDTMKELEQLKQELGSRNIQCQNLKYEIQQKDTTICQNAEEVRNMKNELSDKNKELQWLEAHISQNRQEARDLQEARSSQEAEYQQKINTLERHFSDRTQEEEILKRELSKKDKAVSQLQSQISQNHQEAEAQIQHLNTKNKRLVSQLNDQSHNQHLEAELMDMKKKVSEQEVLLAQVRHTLKSKEEELQKEVNMVKDLQDAKISQEAEYQKKINTWGRHFSDREQEVSKKDNEILALRNRNKELDKQLSHTMTKLEQLQLDLESRNLQLHRKDVSINEHAEKEKELQGQISEKDKEIKSLKRQISDRKQDIEVLKREVEMKEKEIWVLRNDVNRRNKELERCQTQLSDTDRKVEQLHQELESRNTECQNLKSEMQRKNDTIFQNAEEIRKIREKISEKDKHKAGLESQVHKLQESLSSKEALIQRLNASKEHGEIRKQQEQNEEIMLLKRQLQETKQELNKLNWDLSKKDELIQQLEMAKAKSKKTDISSRGEMKVKQLEQDLKYKSTEYENLKHEIYEKEDTIHQLQQKVKNKDDKIQELSGKLAAEMSVKVSADESQVENVSIKNRPMNISEEYQLICSNQWLDAKGVIDDLSMDNTPDYVKIQLLCEILLISAQTANELLTFINEALQVQLQDPVKFAFEGYRFQSQAFQEKVGIPGAKSASKPTQISKELANLYGDILRNSSDKCEVDLLVQHVTSVLISHSSSPNIAHMVGIWNRAKEVDLMKGYLSSVARLCWKMAIQRPQMEFQLSDKWKGEKHQEVFWNSDSVPNAKVFHVYPMLYHGQSLMAKGKVLLLDPRKMV